MGNWMHHGNAWKIRAGTRDRHPPWLQKSTSEGHRCYFLQLLWSAPKPYGKRAKASISQMIRQGYVIQTDGEYSVLKVGNISELQKNTRILVKKFKEKEKISISKKRKASYKKSYFENENTSGSSNTASDSSSLNAAKKSDLFEALRQLRLQIAREESVPPYIVFTDKTLINMCEKLPQTEAEMLNVSGVGQNKLQKYGQRFLQEIAVFLTANTR